MKMKKSEEQLRETTKLTRGSHMNVTIARKMFVIANAYTHGLNGGGAAALAICLGRQEFYFFLLFRLLCVFSPLCANRLWRRTINRSIDRYILIYTAQRNNKMNKCLLTQSFVQINK